MHAQPLNKHESSDFCKLDYGFVCMTLPVSLALQVSARLPAPVQVLNAAAAYRRRAERGNVVQQSLSGGAGSIPGCGLDALGAAAHQIIDEIEDQQVRPATTWRCLQALSTMCYELCV